MLIEASRLLEEIDRPLAVEIRTEACSAQLGVADAEGVLAAAERAQELVERLPEGGLHDLVALTRGWAQLLRRTIGRRRAALRDAVSTAATLDPLGLVRISGALEWLDRWATATGTPAATFRRLAPTAQSAFSRTCSTSRPGTRTGPGC